MATDSTGYPARAARPGRREALTSRGFVVHYLQMVVAMIAGMVLLMPLAMLVPDAGIEVEALLMATSMSVGMAALMVWRRSSVAAIVEMCLAMYLAFVVLMPAYWLGWLSAGALMALGHVIMLPAMALVMLRRREEYLAH